MAAAAVATPVRADERALAVAMLERALRPGSEAWLAAEQPAIFSDVATGELCIVRSEGAVVAGAACVAREVSTPGGKLRIGLIGSVATEEAFRGCGLASAAMNACEQWLRDAGCAAAVLWADVPDFYIKRGYGEAGIEEIILMPPLNELDAAGTCENYLSDDLHSVERIRMREAAHTDRPRAESAYHYSFPGTNVYVYREKSGRVSAYAALGRGGDLQNVVHECGGTAQGIFALVSHIINIHSLPEAVCILSAHRTDILEIVRSAGIATETGSLGMVKCLDREKLILPLRPALPENVVIELMEGKIKLIYNGNAIEIDDGELVHAVIGHKESRDPLNRIEAVLALPRMSLVPMRPSFGGFDSI
ncbi:MAG: GNAT family N-acetyltransferase [Planctomycetes bacterium]|nr:GNAT family N-acetyltransferase [Planctomycetota bacterium]